MKRYLKIISVAFLAGVGGARVLVWLRIVFVLFWRGGWEVAAAVKAAPWVLAALGGGLILSIAGMLADSKHYEHSAQKQQTTVKTSNERKAG